MQTVIFGVGVSGTGKTSFLKKFSEKGNFVRICPDDIRDRPKYRSDSYDPSLNKFVWSDARTELAQAIISGKSVVFDATFVNPRDRKGILDFIGDIEKSRKIQVKKIAVVFEAELEVSKRRNSTREDKKPIPDDFLERMYDNLQLTPPQLSEGFESVLKLDCNKDLPNEASREIFFNEMKTRVNSACSESKEIEEPGKIKLNIK